MTKPNFIIVGVARCGTTSLFHYLNQHPQIGFPKKKEPKYFSAIHLKFPQRGVGDETVDEKIVKDFDEYKSLFKGLDNYKMIGEASSDYFFYHKNTIPEIRKTLGDIPIIISIRNPIERSYSAYNNLVRDGRETLSFKVALDKEEERIREGWDWMWAYKKGSLYAEGIEAFKGNFSKVKVILFEELQDNPLNVLHEVEIFLGLQKFNDYNTSVKYSPSGNPKNPLIKLISSRNSKLINVLRTTVMSIFPRKTLETIAKGFFAKGEIDEDVKMNLKNYFKKDIVQTEKLIEKSLDFWK
ncbi:MAG TPA: sulfotransferase [Salinimicrobium sp.]|nr:sulfotransferase [Salinimicrobium sp.]